MLVSLIATTIISPGLVARVERGFANLLRPPFSLDLTIGKGQEKILWERPSGQSERFRLTYDGTVVEYRSRGRDFLEVDWVAREYFSGSKALEDFGPFGEVDDTLTYAYPFVIQMPNLGLLLRGAKVSEPAKNVIVVHRGPEKLTVVFSANGWVSKFTQTVLTREGTVTRDWVVSASRKQAAPIDANPPRGMLPISFTAGQWTLDSTMPLPDLMLYRAGRPVRFSTILTRELTVIELVGPKEAPQAGLAKLAESRKLGHLIVGPGRSYTDPDLRWEHTFAQGGYPMILIVDRERRVHLAFQGRMPEMIDEIEEYLRSR